MPSQPLYSSAGVDQDMNMTPEISSGLIEKLYKFIFPKVIFIMTVSLCSRTK